MKITNKDVIKEHFNKIADDYDIDSTPLGSGKIIFIGSFGEVRLATHKITG